MLRCVIKLLIGVVILFSTRCPSPKKAVKRSNSEMKWNGYGKEIGQEERIENEKIKISLNFRKCAANLSKNEGMTV